MAWQGIVFDLDGTLVDTEPLHRDAWLDTLSTYHLNYDEAWFSQWIGQSDRTLASWVVANALHQMDEETLLESKRKKYYRLASEYTPLFRGVGEALPILASKYALAIATNSSNEDAEAVFLSTRIEPYFKAIVTSNKVAHMKPAPDPYLQAASLLQIDPKKLIAVEDSPAGITAARQAGLYTLGVTNSHPEDKLKEADKIFPSTQDALIWITR
ncbi:MAG TPA: HAD family phosphatase [Saprospiraceae bacterium]|nr:HAD family phosphatase [Saprospiraceae bacterium]MCB9268789.1 HAD family phosphatase [Lewinellaceae bacterium]HPG05623.1 HAD family phosphatase [Saprospiraceae bacterium]HPR01410.1 HAD family phosphatase [Saprospiraceae bacterium]HQU52387.1 HAD family phosphatase [Saprospiraceae bacterium]